MPSPNRRAAIPASTSTALAGIIACLGALVDEAEAIGDTRAANVLLVLLCHKTCLIRVAFVWVELSRLEVVRGFLILTEQQ